MIKKIFTITIVLFFALCANKGLAQGKKEDKTKNFKKDPHWIAMMQDSSVNYFEATHAFNEFWKDRKAPIEDDVIENGKEKEKEDKSILYKLFHASEIKEEKETEQYRFEHKKFKHWQLMVEPYVQPDGRILSSEEQLEIWRSQRQ